MNKPHIPKIHLQALSLLLLLISPTLFAQESEDSIGRVITVQGTVQARTTTGELRNLRRGSDFYTLETIITAEDSETQLRFNDTALVTLAANSEFTIDEYVSDGVGGAADSVIMSLVTGGLRTISGTIGDDDQDDYRLDMPFASMGIRGTEYEVLLSDGGRAVIAVFEGSVTVALPGGGPVTVLGIGGEADAAEVEEGTEVILLEDIPEELGNLLVQLVDADALLALPTVTEEEETIILENILPGLLEDIVEDIVDDNEAVVEGSGGPVEAREDPVSPN